MKKYSVISLFSGAMGLDLGFKYTNRYELLACFEKEKVFCDTIRLNQIKGRISSKTLIFEGDINNYNPKDILEILGKKPGEIDVIIGGPPCQSFSTAGKRQSIQDPRGTLLWSYLRFVEVIKPKFFIMENVRGILSASLKHRKIADRPENGGESLSKSEITGSVVHKFALELNSIKDAAYRVDCFEVNSVNYGSPQIRERVLFIGNRYNAKIDFPRPTHFCPQKKAQQNSLLESNPTELPWRTLGDAILNLDDPSPEILDFSPRKKFFLSKVPQGGNWRCLPEELQKESMGKAYFAKGGRSGWWRRLSFDLPCPTLVTMPNHASTSLCHPKETRALSVREYARIQEFPDDWEFCGTTSEKYAQIGNAVPTRLGKISGTLISQKLDELASREFLPFEGEWDFFSIIYIQSHVRTRKWYKNGEVFTWEDGAKNNTHVAYTNAKTFLKECSIGV